MQRPLAARVSTALLWVGAAIAVVGLVLVVGGAPGAVAVPTYCTGLFTMSSALGLSLLTE